MNEEMNTSRKSTPQPVVVINKVALAAQLCIQYGEAGIVEVARTLAKYNYKVSYVPENAWYIMRNRLAHGIEYWSKQGVPAVPPPPTPTT